jgi:enamine deaminase RidA (YjgF/YER057c/UK114 family)
MQRIFPISVRQKLLVEVSRLIDPDVMIEIEVTAVVK